MDKCGDMICLILDELTSTNEQDTCRRVTCFVLKRPTMCIKAEGGHFEYLQQQWKSTIFQAHGG